MNGNDAKGRRDEVAAGTPEAEWNRRYQEYLGRIAERSEQIRELYAEVVDHISAGNLAPAALEHHLAVFGHTHGPRYVNALSEVSIGFLTGLVELALAYPEELVEALMPDADVPGRQGPPALDPVASPDWFRRITDYAVDANAAVAKMLRSIMDKVAAGELAPEDIEKAAARSVPARVARLVDRYFDLLTDLDDVHAEYGRQYLDAVLEPVRTGSGEVELKGFLGATKSLRVDVANTAAETAAVRCVMSDVRRSDGVGPAFQPGVTISPERCELGPGEERSVVLSLLLAEDFFEPGRAYSATFRVLGSGETLLEVPLRIQVLAAAAVAASGSRSRA